MEGAPLGGLRPADSGKVRGQSRLAESESRNSVACDCLRRKEAGQAVETGPRKASKMAFAFRFSGAMHNMRCAEQSAGIVRVNAYGGTAARFGKWPSLTCCCRQAWSSCTNFTFCGS